jgi:hypothetical protein
MSYFAISAVMATLFSIGGSIVANNFTMCPCKAQNNYSITFKNLKFNSTENRLFYSRDLKIDEEIKHPFDVLTVE